VAVSCFQAHLLEQLGAQAIRLVDDERGDLATQPAFAQDALELVSNTAFDSTPLSSARNVARKLRG
jgi:hypothetical protein